MTLDRLTLAEPGNRLQKIFTEVEAASVMGVLGSGKQVVRALRLGTNLSIGGTPEVPVLNATGGGGSTPPGGANREIQFNNSGAFGGSPKLTFPDSFGTILQVSNSTSLQSTFVTIINNAEDFMPAVVQVQKLGTTAGLSITRNSSSKGFAVLSCLGDLDIATGDHNFNLVYPRMRFEELGGKVLMLTPTDTNAPVKFQTAPSIASKAGFRLVPGDDVTSGLEEGDMWADSVALWYRKNGISYQVLVF